MREDISYRIDMIRHDELPAGYAYGRLGIHPIEWISKRVSAMLELAIRPVNMQDNIKYKLLIVRRAYGGVRVRSELFGRDILVKSQFEVQYHDFIISKRQIVHGACGLVQESTVGAIVSNEYNVFTAKEGVNVSFFDYYMQLPRAQHLFYLMSVGVHIEKMLFSTKDWLRKKVAIPQSGEQDRIVEILNQCHKVIELKQQFIDEERRRKKWLVQNLLDPDSGVRMPRFGDEWESYLIKEIAIVISGGTPATSNTEYWNGSILWCTPTDISKSGKYIDNTEQTISESGVRNSSATLLPIGTVLMCSRASIGPKAIAVQEITTNQGFKSFICSKKLNNEFLYYLLDVILDDLLRLASGNTFKELSKDSVDNFIITIPDIVEQNAIAGVLATQDNLIEMLVQELTQWQQKKKALMQLLLTGIVRVSV